MSRDVQKERKRIQQRILALRKDRDVQAAYGDVVKADELLDQIASLQCQVNEIDRKEQEAREQATYREHKFERSKS
jgi:hypothetical protein